MITKIHPPHPNLALTLRYNFKKVEKSEAKVLYTRGLRFSDNDTITFLETKDRMYKSMPEEFRAKNIVFHASINPHISDSLSEAMMESFIDDYMEKLGYGAQPYIVFKHEDINRTHYHVVSLNIDRNGRKINDSFIKRRSWKILQELSKKYGILPPNQHLKEERELLLSSPPQPIIYKEGNLVEKIKYAIDYALEIYRPKSIGELSAILLGYNINLESIKNRHTEEEEGGLLLSIIDEQNNRQSVGIKATDLGYYYLKKQLEAQLRENKSQWKKERANRIKYAVAWALRNAKDPVKFVDNMEEIGINTLLRFNKEGRIYGVTFIDTKRGTVCNGSDIGKDYSANILNDYFSGEIAHRWVINTDRSEYIKKAISETLEIDMSLDKFIQSMEEKGIETMLEKGQNGEITNFIFADHKHYVLTNTNQLSNHYSTVLLQDYFQNDGENFWKDDLVNRSERVLYAEKNSYSPRADLKSNDDTILDDIIDSRGSDASGNKALAIGRMYQRQAERNWGKTRRR